MDLYEVKISPRRRADSSVQLQNRILLAVGTSAYPAIILPCLLNLRCIDTHWIVCQGIYRIRDWPVRVKRPESFATSSKAMIHTPETIPLRILRIICILTSEKWNCRKSGFEEIKQRPASNERDLVTDDHEEIKSTGNAKSCKLGRCLCVFIFWAAVAF